MSTQIHRLPVGSMAANCYVIIDEKTRQALIVDPGDDAEYLTQKLAQLRAVPSLIVATHGHFDHIMAARALQLVYAIPFLIHSKDVFLLSAMQESARHFLGIVTDPPPVVSTKLADKETISLGKTSIKVFHTPGHTPGSVCLSLENEKSLVVGDTIFAQGAVGRTDFSYSDFGRLKDSLQTILSFPAETALWCGHGEPTTIEHERKFHVTSGL